MNAFKFSAVALALVASFSASAMTSIQDADLAQVSGQDGVSIGADLHINVGAFTWGNSVNNASISFKNIDITGLLLVNIDLLTSAQYQTAVETSLAALGTVNATALTNAGNAALGYVAGSDVIVFSFPQVGPAAMQTTLARAVTPTIKVGAIATGNGGASFGSMTIQNLDLQGTKVYMFGH